MAKDMAVRQYLIAIQGFVEVGDFFRADANFQNLMDLYPRLKRKVKNELDVLDVQWKAAMREEIVPSIDLSELKHSMRKN